MTRSEEILHQTISEKWNNGHRNNHPEKQRLICHWNNGESGRSGNKMMVMGVKKGVADWQYLHTNGLSIWIELKTEDGVQSPEQVRFQSLCELLGHEYHIVRDEQTFWNLIGWWPL